MRDAAHIVSTNQCYYQGSLLSKFRKKRNVFDELVRAHFIWLDYELDIQSCGCCNGGDT